MKISIIIPVKPGGAVAAINGLKRIDADSPDHEVLVAEGKKPSRQRNMAAGAASGDIIYFLDDDALVVPDALKRIAASFSGENVAAVGGPSLTPPDDSPLQRTIAWALSSLFGGGGIRNRYRRVGQLRDSDDRELILCNLAFRREVYLSFGGLDERLYPNEENELIDRLLHSGARLLHDPAMYVVRSQRPTLAAFIRQMKTYGRGRAEQTLLSRRVSFKALLPALFAIYTASLLFIHLWWYFTPAGLYAVGVLANMPPALKREGVPVAARLPMIYFLLHFCYGAGFIVGLFSPRYKKAAEKEVVVTVNNLKKFGCSW